MLLFSAHIDEPLILLPYVGVFERLHFIFTALPSCSLPSFFVHSLSCPCSSARLSQQPAMSSGTFVNSYYHGNSPFVFLIVLFSIRKLLCADCSHAPESRDTCCRCHWICRVSGEKFCQTKHGVPAQTKQCFETLCFFFLNFKRTNFIGCSLVCIRLTSFLPLARTPIFSFSFSLIPALSLVPRRWACC